MYLSGRIPRSRRCRAIPVISRFFVSLHNLWPKRWVGYDRVGAGLFGFPASIWDTRIANRFVFNFLFSDGSTAPLPARTSADIRRKLSRMQ